MKVKIKKWDNSPAVTIPAAIMQASQLAVDEVVDVRVEAGCIVIKPVGKETYDLCQLIRGITAGNQHETVDFGLAQGIEVW
jgi:antitoxin MazE